MRDAGRQTLGFEAEDRLARRAAADVEPHRNFIFAERTTGLDVADDDGVDDAFENLICESLTRDRVIPHIVYCLQFTIRVKRLVLTALQDEPKSVGCPSSEPLKSREAGRHPKRGPAERFRSHARMGRAARN